MEVFDTLREQNGYQVLDKFTSAVDISTVRHFLYEHGIEAFNRATDTMAFYVGNFMSALTEFSQGCSLGEYTLDHSATVELIKLMGIAI